MPNILEQAKTFTNKLSKNQKWLLGGLSILVIGGIIALVITLYEPPEKIVLANNLEAIDASRVIEYLKANNIDYELKDNSSTIIVPKERADEIRMAIATQGLIQDSYVGYELFDKTNLGMSEYVQQLNGRRALEGELQRTIKSMKEIKDVKVHIVIPKKVLFKSEEKQPTAAVTLKFKNIHSLSKMDIEGIQNIVASSVEGMDPAKVVVTDNYGRIISETIPDKNSLAGITSSQLKQQQQLESYLSNKVQDLLDPAFGTENSKVKLNTEIDFDQLEVNKKDWDPDRQVARSEQTNTDNYKNADTSFVPGTDEQSTKENVITNYEITNADSHFVKGIGGIKRLTITAIVNEDIKIEKLKDGRDTVIVAHRPDTLRERLENAIKTAVGYDSNRGDQVNVLFIPFSDILADKITEVNERNDQNGIKWWEKENNQRLILLLLTLLITAIVMFKIINAKFAKDKMRIAMGLPEKLEKPMLAPFDSNLLELPQEEEPEDENDDDYYEEEEALEALLPDEVAVEEIMDDMEENFDEMEIDDEDMLILPDELPDQILLEDNLLNEMDIFGLNEEEYIPEQTDGGDSLLDRARAALSQGQNTSEEVSEDELIKMELRDKVSAFIIDAPDIAVRLFRVFYNQDNVN